jgi:hypothetical protein
MGFLDKLLRRCKDVASEHGDEVSSGVDKATDVADDKSGGKYSEQLQQADDAVDRAVGEHDGPSDPPPPASEMPPPPSSPAA